MFDLATAPLRVAGPSVRYRQTATAAAVERTQTRQCMVGRRSVSVETITSSSH